VSSQRQEDSRPASDQPLSSSENWDPGSIAFVAFVIGGVAALLAGLCLWFRPRRSRFRIVILRTPAGEAPEHIRRAWIGLELPLAPGESGPQRVDTVAVLSGGPTGSKQGYLVAGPAALQALEARSPEAAAWWRQNVPQVAEAGYRFVFPADCCKKVEATSPRPGLADSAKTISRLGLPVTTPRG
jgi:hypothetical protein